MLRLRLRPCIGLAAAIVAGVVTAVLPVAAPPATARPARPAGRYVVRASSPADLVALRSQLRASGAVVDDDLGPVQGLVVELSGAAADVLAGNAGVATLARSGPRMLSRPEGPAVPIGPGLERRSLGAADPASSRSGLMWNLDRIGAARANTVTRGRGVTVAVVDTGLDPTHRELQGRLAGQVDLSDPAVCRDAYGETDADLAARYGGPVTGDWNGHGTWMAGTIAANLDGVGVNGIAPEVQLLDLKISQWCGAAADDAILGALVYAADHGVDVVSIAFGGYLDRTDPEQDALYRTYADVVAYARSKGTLVVASAGNEHVRLGAGGRVLSHGQLAAPGEVLDDLFGRYSVPGGVTGVMTVAATNNVVAPSARGCRVAVGDLDAVCKPSTDRHQPSGVGRTDQLAYYSNYGPRIDIAAPGGARKFNVPAADGGGTWGFPWTRADGFAAFGAFSITSNWAAFDIPCFTHVGVGYPDQCYTTIQGTSMAAPHVAAVAALIVATNRSLRGRPAAVVEVLVANAASATNTTPALSATDTSPGDRTGVACPSGYCHLGGRAIADAEAYGAGVVDAARAVAAAR